MASADRRYRRPDRSPDQVLRATAKTALAAWMSYEPRSIEQIRGFLEAHFAKPVVRRTAERYRDWMIDGYGAVPAATGGGAKRWIVVQADRQLAAQVSQQHFLRCQRGIEWLEREGKRQWAAALRELLVDTQPAAGAEAAPMVPISENETVALRPGPRVKPSAWVEAALQRALQSNRAIRARYRLTKTSAAASRSGRVIDAVIHPYGLVYGDRAFLVGGYDAARGLERDQQGRRRIGWYLLERFEKIELTDLPRLGHGQFNLREYVQQWFGVPRGDEEPFEVEWRFSPAVADRAEQYRFHPTQLLVREPDGSLTVRFRAAGSLEMDWHLYTWGGDVQVIQPPPEVFGEKVRQQREHWRTFFR